MNMKVNEVVATPTLEAPVAGMNPETGEVATEKFGERALARTAETASYALAEQAKAAVQARYIMALQRPRDLMRTRQTLLTDCKRPRFAETAIYRKPVGDGVEGPSIRLAEAAARAMGNVYPEVASIYDDREKRIMRVSATDLECNVTYSLDVTLAKTIERSRPIEGRKVLSIRKNSKGRDVYLIEATDDEILDRERALCSKALRTCILRLVPGDILEEALEQCLATRRGEIQRDPAAARKKMVDAFQAIGVSAAQLGEYLGHAVDSVSAEEIDELRALYNAIKDKETTWAAAMDARKGESGGASAKPTTDTVQEVLAKKAGEVKA
jgi:hypothetical protein